jgi:hypothetical protein
MRKLLTIAMVLCMVGVAAASDLGNLAPVKATVTVPENVPNPELQGGDTIFTATVIPSIPYSDTGTTAGYVNDYDEACPYTGSTSPDVVYSYTPTALSSVTVDLCYSQYDTKVYVYNSSLALVACNDDFWFDLPCYTFSSRVENVPMSAGETYYIVVDGYGGSFGTYQIDVAEIPPCVVDCPAGGIPEGEPALFNGYTDNYDGGCNTPGYPFVHIPGDNNGEAILCGVSGWYLSAGGTQYRDTDWYTLTMGVTGSMDITVDAEVATYIFELGPQDCSVVAVIQNAIGGPCLEAYMTIAGYAPGGIVWFWVGPTVFVPPSGNNPEMYDYVCWFSGLEPEIATENTNWSTMKALFE